jgi:hypothetical protein
MVEKIITLVSILLRKNNELTEQKHDTKLPNSRLESVYQNSFKRLVSLMVSKPWRLM